jgi:hypothetical protein
VANNPSSINYYSSFYDDEEIVDCEPESPAKYLCDEGDISPAHGNGPDSIIRSMSNLPVTFDGRLQRAWPEALAKVFREGVVSGAFECGAPEPGSQAEGENIFPLQYSLIIM